MMDLIDDDVSMSSSEDEEDFSEEALKIGEYRKNINENTEDYDSYVSLIKGLRYSDKLEEARAVREQMNMYFPLTPEMWIEWASDERAINSNKLDIYNLLRKATEDYRSVEVWSELCQSALGCFDDKNEIRKIFEEAISQVGTQFARGSVIWLLWMIYEKEVVMGGLEGKDLEDQRDRVFKLYMRQLSIPLEGNDKIFNEFLEWNSEWHFSEDEIRIKFEQSDKLSETFRPFEKVILDADIAYASQKIEPQQISKEEGWVKYLEFATEHMNKGDIINLFERALTDVCLSQLLWSNYLSYLSKHFDRDHDRLLSVGKRAIRNNKSSLDLRLSLVRNMERFFCPADEIRATFNAILRAKLADAYPFLPLWQSYLDFERRQLDMSESGDLTIIRGLFDRLVSFENYLDYDPCCSLTKYWAFIEARYGEGMEKSRELWSMIRKSLGHNDTALWLENLEFERRFGDFDSCKRLASNAVNSVNCNTNNPQYLFERVLRWVAEAGNIENYVLFKKKIDLQQVKLNEKLIKEAESKKQEKSERKLKRKPEQSPTKPQKKQKVNDSGSIKEERPNPKEHIPMEKLESVETCEERSVFVSNLSFQATEDDLRSIFSKSGTVEDVRIAKRLTGESKGFAYVQFVDGASVTEALKLEHAPLLERPMYVQLCDKTKRHKFTYVVGEPENNKLFVKNLPKTVTKAALETIFGGHGPLTEVRLVTMKNGTPKGIAYVEYRDEDSASRALVACHGLVVGDNAIEVFISRTPVRAAAGTVGGGDSSDTRKDSAVHGGSFIVPRAVSKVATTQKRLIHPSTNPGRSTSSSEPSSSTAMSNADFKKFLG